MTKMYFYHWTDISSLHYDITRHTRLPKKPKNNDIVKILRCFAVTLYDWGQMGWDINNFGSTMSYSELLKFFNDKEISFNLYTVKVVTKVDSTRGNKNFDTRFMIPLYGDNDITLSKLIMQSEYSHIIFCI
jgi:hypothetical protein